MRYDRFVELREERWASFRARLDILRHRPSELDHQALEGLATEYRQVLHDHALAASRFPGSWAARQLEDLVVQGNHALRWERAGELPSLRRFYGRTFPALFRAHLPELAVAVVLFAIGALLGLVLCSVEPAVGVAFVGPEALAGLRSDRLWTETLEESGAASYFSSMIATNNMGVALTAWLGGAAAGLLSLYVVVLNGFLFGAVTGLTLHYGMAARLFEFVAAHGPLEITLILVSAAAGLRVGRTLVTASEVPRAQRLPRAARDSLLLVLGCLPWFLLLGVVEASVSPARGFPPGLKLAAGLALEALFLSVAVRPGWESPREQHGAPA